MNRDTPVFELTDVATKRKWRIWADGRTEGWPEGTVIVNRVPQAIRDAVLQDREQRKG